MIRYSKNINSLLKYLLETKDLHIIAEAMFAVDNNYALL